LLRSLCWVVLGMLMAMDNTLLVVGAVEIGWGDILLDPKRGVATPSLSLRERSRALRCIRLFGIGARIRLSGVRWDRAPGTPRSLRIP
jgi:hypothetical protein